VTIIIYIKYPSGEVLGVTKLKCLPVISFLFFFSAAPLLGDAVTIDDSLEILEIGRHVEYLEDKENKLALIDVTGKKQEWKQSEKNALNFGFTHSAYWFKFSLTSNQKKTSGCYLEIDYPMLDYIELYTPRPDGSFDMTKAGDHYPFYNRKIIDRNFIFRLYPVPQELTYYVHIKTTSSINFKPILWSQYSFEKRNTTEQPLMFMYYGLMLVMVVYNLLIFLSVKDSTYIYYSASILSFILFQLILNGYAFQYLWPNSIWWANNCLPCFMGITLGLTAVFLMKHINARTTFPVIYRVAKFGLVVPNLAWALASLLFNYRIGILVATALAGYTALVLYTMGIYVVIKRSRAGYFVLVGYTMLAIGVMAYVLKTFGILPANFFTTWSIQIGSAMVVIILSLSLADEINRMKNDLQDINLNLEKKVLERTSELKRARDQLWGEMELAKKIQTVLLPKQPRITGYEMSAYMMPAAEVGGDYYDVINVQDRDWIIIGDVSGHGVPAGLIMMMVQTSINTIVSHNPDLPPSVMLEAINKTITKNVRLIDQDKYMTITVLATHKDGKFFFSGLHQDILILRAETGTVDTVETDGLWLGLDADMRPKATDNILQLNIGDLMLIYTDGITEAWHKGTVKNLRDPENDMFGADRLKEIFRSNWKKSTDEIKNAIIFALTDYQCQDDVTMVLMRRKG
jgi:serine phosphatase RsbU (regulator of sigma subunit)